MNPKVIEGAFRPKCEPETVAELRRLADRLESGEVEVVTAMYLDPELDEYRSLVFASPRDGLLMTTMLHKSAVDRLYEVA